MRFAKWKVGVWRRVSPKSSAELPGLWPSLTLRCASKVKNSPCDFAYWCMWNKQCRNNNKPITVVTWKSHWAAKVWFLSHSHRDLQYKHGMDKGSFNLALKLLIFDMLYEYSKRPLINMLALSARSCDGYQRFFFSVCSGVFLPHLSQIT